MSILVSLIEAPEGTAEAAAPKFHDYQFNNFERFFLKEGVIDAAGGSLEVTERAAGANMTVDIAPGSAIIEITNTLTDSTTYLVYFTNTAVASASITTADGTFERIDRVSAVVSVATAPNATASNIGSFVVSAGTPAGSPSAPATPSNAISLATVSIPASDTTIADAQITDTRVEADVKDTTVLPAFARATETAALRADSVTWLGTITGTNTLTGSATPAPTAYAAGQRFAFIVANTCSGAVTLNVNSLGAKNLYGPDGTALGTGDIVAGGVVEARYDGTQFVMTSAKHATASSSHELLFSNAAASSEAGASTTAEVEFDLTYTIAPAQWAVGTLFRITHVFQSVHNNSDNNTLRSKIGSTNLLAITYTNSFAGVRSAPVIFNTYIRCITIGSSGTYTWWGHAIVPNGYSDFVNNLTHSQANGKFVSDTSTTTTIQTETADMTGNLIIKGSTDFGGSSGNNKARLQTLMVERLTATATA